MPAAGRNRLDTVLLLAVLLTCRGAGLAQAAAAGASNPDRVPSALGLPAKDAKAVMHAAGFEAKFRVGMPPPSADQALTTYAQDPPSGAAAARGAVITMTLYGQATGPAGHDGRRPPFDRPPTEGQPVTVPSLLGRSAVEAKGTLVALGLVPRFQVGARAGPAGKALAVYDQDPKPGTAARRGAAVRVTIYPRPTPALRASERNGIDDLTHVTPSRSPIRQTETIDPRSARLVVTATDLVNPAGPVTLELRRSLRTGPGKRGLLGARWQLDWESSLTQAGRQARLQEGGRTVVFTLDESTEQYRNPSGEFVVFEPDRAVRTLTDGRKEVFDARGRLVERIERNDGRVVLRYDQGGFLSKIEGPNGSFVQLTVDARGLLTKAESSTGAAVLYNFGPEAPPAGPDAAEWTTGYGYNAAGALIRVRVPHQGETAITYDAQGRVTSRRRADGTAERFEHDDATHTRRHFDPLGNVTTLTWSPDGRRLQVVDAEGRKTVVEDDDDGRPVAFTGPTGLETRLTYDALGRLSRVAGPKGVTRFEYAGESRLPRMVIDAANNTRTFDYDSRLNLVRMTASENHALDATFAYDANGSVIGVQQGDGLRHSYTYDAAGRRDSITDAAGNTWRFAYDAFGNLLNEVDPRGGVTRRTYDEHDRLTSLTDATGATTTWGYALEGSSVVVTVTDPRGNASRLLFDEQGRLSSVEGPADRKARLDYDPAGRLARIENEAGQVYQIAYDPAGRLARSIDPAGGVTTSDYDALGRMTSLTTPAGEAVRIGYSPDGLPIRIRAGAGPATEFGYDARGRMVSTTDEDGQATRYEYDGAGRLTRITPSDGASVDLAYDERGNLARFGRGRETLVAYEYDELLRVVRCKPGGGAELSFRYDASGNLIGWRDDAGGHGTAEYDAVGRPLSKTDAAGATTRFRYDPAGNLVEIRGPLADVERRSFDAAGGLVEVTEPDGTTARYGYDRAGRLESVVRPGGGRDTYSYDSPGMTAESTNPLGQKTRSTYDNAGRLISRTDAKGQTTAFDYDQMGRLHRKRLADGKAVVYRYDECGKLGDVDDGVFPVHYTADDHGRVLRIDYPAIKQSLAYTYNSEGQRTRFADSQGGVVDYEYDAFDRLSAIRLGEARTFGFSYDAQGRPAAVQYPNGVRGTWRYDATGRPAGVVYTDRSGKTLAGWTYVYDAAGNPVQAIDAQKRAVRYRYDAAGQLVEEDPGAGEAVRYGYLPGGNRGTREYRGEVIRYRYDQDDRLLGAGREAFAYDPNGNLIERRGPGGLTRYEYDTEDRLVRVVLPGGAEVTFGYAPTGERVWRRDSTGLTHFVTAGLDVVAELDENLKPRARYVHAPGIDRLLLAERDGRARYYHADLRGSVRALTDPTGAVVQLNDYDAFGVPKPVGKSRDPSLFTGREYDRDTGLYDYRLRYYEPTLGRFLSPDPVPGRVASPRSLNPYLYVRNSPLRYRDPLGADIDDLAHPWAFSDNSAENATHYPLQNPVQPVRGTYNPFNGGARVFPQAFTDGGVPAAWGTAVHETTHGIDFRSIVAGYARRAGLDPSSIPKDIQRKIWDRLLASPAQVNALERSARWEQAHSLIELRGLGPDHDVIQRVIKDYAKYGGNSAILDKAIRDYHAWLSAASSGHSLPPSPVHQVIQERAHGIMRSISEGTTHPEGPNLSTPSSGSGGDLSEAGGGLEGGSSTASEGAGAGRGVRRWLPWVVRAPFMALSGRRVYHSPNPGKTAAEEVASWTGGEVGATIGAPLGPPGSIAGGFAGGFAGPVVVDWVYTVLTGGGGAPPHMPPGLNPPLTIEDPGESEWRRICHQVPDDVDAAAGENPAAPGAGHDHYRKRARTLLTQAGQDGRNGNGARSGNPPGTAPGGGYAGPVVPGYIGVMPNDGGYGGVIVSGPGGGYDPAGGGEGIQPVGPADFPGNVASGHGGEGIHPVDPGEMPGGIDSSGPDDPGGIIDDDGGPSDDW